MDIYNLVSFLGIFVLAGVAWLCSSNRKVINWRVVLWGIGGIGGLVPERLKDLSRLGFRALLAATLACLMTGAVAGAFFSRASILLGQ